MSTAPVPSPRYIELDAMRGFAVMGILLMNIMGFAMPEMAYINPTVYGGSEGSDLIAWVLGFIFVDGKMRGLFSLLFGASMMLVIAGAQAKGADPAKTHYSRMLWLALFGLFHFFFIWWGDILFLYAVVGCIAFRFHQWETGRLLKWAFVIYFSGALLFGMGMGSLFFLQAAASAPDATAAAIAEYEEAAADIIMSPQAVKDEIALYLGSYWQITWEKINERWFLPFVNPTMMVFETLPFMMIGMACLKNGFVFGNWDTARYRKWAVSGIGVGGAAYAILAWIDYNSGFDEIVVMNANMAWSMIPRLIMTFGYAAALMLLIKTMIGTALLARIACAGRAAFSNYLGTSILMTFIFYGWGIGLFGSIGRMETYLFVPSTWALMLLWSKPWLTRFRYGPLEWLWRSLARMQMQPMRLNSQK